METFLVLGGFQELLRFLQVMSPAILPVLRLIIAAITQISKSTVREDSRSTRRDERKKCSRRLRRGTANLNLIHSKLLHLQGSFLPSLIFDLFCKCVRLLWIDANLKRAKETVSSCAKPPICGFDLDAA